MDYIGNNKAAWEEAFDHKQDGWGEENYKRLLNEDLPFFCKDMAAELRSMDFKGRHFELPVCLVQYSGY